MKGDAMLSHTFTAGPVAEVKFAPYLSESSFALRYKLAEKPIASARFKILHDLRHFTHRKVWSGTGTVDWRQVPPDVEGIMYPCQPIDGQLPRLEHVSNALVYVPAQYDHYFIDFNVMASFDAYLAKFSRKCRYNLCREVKKWTEFCGGCCR